MTVTVTDTDPCQQLADLEARVLGGDTSITAATLAKAKAAVEFAELQDAAARRRAEQDAAGQRQTIEDSYRASLEVQARQLVPVQRAYSSAVAALRTLNNAVAAWQQTRQALERQGNALGLNAEVDAVLADLSGRDWIDVARNEASDNYDRGHTNVTVGNVQRASVRYHVLHDAKARDTIAAAEEARNAARDERLRQRATDDEARRQSDRAHRARLQEIADHA